MMAASMVQYVLPTSHPGVTTLDAGPVAAQLGGGAGGAGHGRARSQALRRRGVFHGRLRLRRRGSCVCIHSYVIQLPLCDGFIYTTSLNCPGRVSDNSSRKDSCVYSSCVNSDRLHFES
jgi:hypothetical protein